MKKRSCSMSLPRHSLFDVDGIFENLLPALSRSQPESQFTNLMPRVDVEEHDDQVVIKADLPGVKKEDLHVSLHDGILSIQAQHKEENEEKQGGRVIRRERRVGSYTRSFSVAKGITENDISGDLTDGVLTLSVPKAVDNANQPRRIEIK